MLKLMKGEKGFSLIEVLVALALLGIIASGFLMAIATAYKAIYIADERTTAESLARSQIEYVKELDYIYYSETGHEVYDETTMPPGGYSIIFTAEPINSDTHVPYSFTDVGGILVFDDDVGIQKITVTVQHHDKQVLTLEDFKVDDYV